MSPRILLIAATVATLGGCATPAPVLDLADKSSANVAIVSERLRELAAESDRLYKSRVDNISQLAGVNARSRAQFTYDEAVTRKVGSQSDLDTADDLKAWKQQVDQILAGAADAEKERRDELSGKQTRLDVKSQALQQVAAALATLATKESFADRARVLSQFATTTRDDVKKELDSGTQTANDANALLARIKSSLPVPAGHSSSK
jgi:hypothetical protein